MADEPKYVNRSNLERMYDNIKQREVQTFDTVAAMQAATYLEDGMTCHTNGFYAAGDGGAAYYTVGASGDIGLQGGLYATAVTVTPNELQDTLFANKRICIFGDSWVGAYTGGSAFNPQTYIDSLDVFEGSRKYSQGGAGFSTVGDDDTTSFLELAQSIQTPNRFGIVLIVGGVNDGETVSATDIANVISTIKQKCPYATLYYAQNIVRTGRGMRTNAMRQRDFELAKNGVQILDVYSHFWTATPWFHTDNWHLTAEGYKRFYSLCISQICGGASFMLPTVAKNAKSDLVDVRSGVTINTALLTSAPKQSQFFIDFTVTTALDAANRVLCKIPYNDFLKAPTTVYKATTLNNEVAFYMEDDYVYVWSQAQFTAGTRKVINLIQENGSTIITQQVNSGAFLEY